MLTMLSGVFFAGPPFALRHSRHGANMLLEQAFLWYIRTEVAMNEWITVDPKICGGKPVIRGTRIMVKNILGMVAGGYTVARILEAYPELLKEMVEAALEYAAAVIDEEQVLAHA